MINSLPKTRLNICSAILLSLTFNLGCDSDVMRDVSRRVF